MRRVLLDQGLAPKAAALLRAMGWDALHVSDVGMSQAEDTQILEFAREGDWICVTFDHDFHAYLAITKAGKPSVVFLRATELNAKAQADLLCTIWQTCEDALMQAADTKSIRIRALPLA